MLKKFLLGLFVGFVGFISFSNAISITITSSNGKYNPGSVLFSKSVSTKDLIFTDFVCPGSCGFQIKNAYNLNQYCTFVSLGGGAFTTSTCGDSNVFSSDSFVFDVQDDHFQTITITGIDLSSSCPECETCPEIDTGSILSGACDTNYCVQNDLCPISSGSRSELMINNIVHEGKPLINISIPDNIYWDYATDDNQFDLYVGSGYDQDYIDSVLAINSYRPDNEDFTNMFVSGLTLIFPYIFVALLIVFIWKLLKRIFK